MLSPFTSSIMFHTIGTTFPEWTWRFLTVPWQLFESMLRTLRRMGYRTVLLDEYREIVLAGRLDKERIVALTFDDGYLDNWVYASVLLERYNARGTVFVSGDFIDPGQSVRPRWDGKPDGEKPLSDGFLNVAELRQLDKSGVLDVQSHCMTHTWYSSGPDIVDFRHPGDSYHWMDWNDFSSTKWERVQPASRPETWGEPVYVHQKSLNGPRYFPNPAIAEALRKFAAGQGEGFFKISGWRRRLGEKARELQQSMEPGKMESESDFQSRVDAELGGSARILSELLDKKVGWLCWPGGGYSDTVFDLASRYYTGTTISSSFDNKHRQGLDALGCFRFNRFGPLHIGSNERLRYLGPLTNSLYIEERRTGKIPCRIIRGGLTRLAQWGVL